MEKYKVIKSGLKLFETDEQYQPNYKEGDVLLYSPDGGEFNAAMIWKEDGTDAHDISSGDIDVFIQDGYISKID